MDNENKVTINWYPGHMEKARRQMEEQLKLVDIIIEIRDARMPLASGNPLLDEMASNKERLIILNKADKADPKQNELWVNGFKNVILCDSLNEKNTKKVVDKVKLILKAKLDKARERGIRKKVLRAMVVGIPNTGKSSFINRMAGAAKAKVADKAGVTRHNQWFPIGNGIELLDTPGVLWPKFDDPKVGDRLAFIGSVKDEILDAETLAIRLLDVMKTDYPDRLTERYKITDFADKEAWEVLEMIGKKRGMMIKGGEIDYERASVMLLDEYRGGKLGLISLEKPE